MKFYMTNFQSIKTWISIWKNEICWFELIENLKLYKAVKNLSIEDQIFISYIVKEGRRQTELSLKYEVMQPAICQRFNKLRKILRKNI